MAGHELPSLAKQALNFKAGLDLAVGLVLLRADSDPYALGSSGRDRQPPRPPRPGEPGHRGDPKSD
jgi:hypothetical protein